MATASERALARRIASLEQALAQRTLPQLSNASFYGAVQGTDYTGEQVQSAFGEQEDGTSAPTVFMGPTPPTPSGVTVSAGPTTIKVAWDGSYLDAMVAPYDWSSLEVHASDDPQFVPDPLPDSATRVGTIGQAAGGSMTFQPVTGAVFVRCMTRTLAGKFSDATDAVDAYDNQSDAAISLSGGASFTSLASQGDISVSGTPLVGTLLDPAAPMGILDGFSRGVAQVVNFRNLLAGLSVGDGSAVSAAAATVNLTAGRMYQIVMPWKVNATATSGTTTNVPFAVRLYYEYGPLGAVPDPSQASSPNLVSTNPRLFPVTTDSDGILSTMFPAPTTDDLPYGAPASLKLLLFLTIVRGSMSPDLSASTFWQASLIDVGGPVPVIDATPPGGSAASTFTTTWAASASRSWTANGAQETHYTDRLLQGALDGGTFHSAAVFNSAATAGSEKGKTLAAALAGAAVKKVEFGLQVVWSRTDTAQVQLRRFSGSTLASSDTVTGAVGTKFDFPARNQQAWITVPSSWVTAGDRGIYINTADWTFPNTACHMGGAGWSTVSARPQLRVTYTK